MKAIAAPGYGPLERLAQVELPVPSPGRGEVRVRVVASALNPADYLIVLGTIKLLHTKSLPLFVGQDFSGTVDAVGHAVSELAVGDDVFGFFPYGPGNARGAFAEFVIAKTGEVALKPPGVSHGIAAAAATTGLTALQAIRDLGHLPPRDRHVLVTGVSGGVGSIGVGIAKRLNATVTAVSTGSGLELARRLGADEVLDRAKPGIAEVFRDHFDVVFDASAKYRWRDWRGALKKGGAFVTTRPSLAYAADKVGSLFSRTRAHFVAVKAGRDDLNQLASWLKAGLEVPLASTIPVRDVAKGLLHLQEFGGRVAVQVAGGF